MVACSLRRPQRARQKNVGKKWARWDFSVSIFLSNVTQGQGVLGAWFGEDEHAQPYWAPDRKIETEKSVARLYFCLYVSVRSHCGNGRMTPGNHERHEGHEKIYAAVLGSWLALSGLEVADEAADLIVSARGELVDVVELRLSNVVLVNVLLSGAAYN